MLSAKVLNDRLDVIFEDETTTIDDGLYSDIIDRLAAAREHVNQLERRLTHSSDRLCGGLAMGIRKLQPSLNVSLGRGFCRVVYKTKYLTFKPNLERKIWEVESNRPRFVSQFRRDYSHTTSLIGDLRPLATAIVSFFNAYYRSIGESVEGRGSILVSGQPVTISELAALVMQKNRLLLESDLGSSK